MKNIDINAKIPYLYANLANKTTNSLNNYYSRQDREDAVAEAFAIILKKDWTKEAYIPQTDKEWYAKIHSYARGRLSNATSKAKNREKYARLFAKEPKSIPSHCCDPHVALEKKKRQQALKRMLEILSEKNKISSRDRNIFLRLLSGEAVNAITNDYDNMTANNLYQIKFRIYQLLKKHGRRYLAQARWEIEKQ